MPTILTVDDSSSMQQMLSLTLSQNGFTVVQAKDGQEGLERFRASPPSLVITDLNMPRMDGLELIRQVRALPNGRFIPILMLTTESDDAKKAAGKAAGATGWVVKPFKPEQLVAVVRKVLG